MPGPGVEAIDWLCSLGVKVVGSDTIAFVHIPAGKSLSALPGHNIILVDHGVTNIETLDLKHLAAAGPAGLHFVMAPPKPVGATASPVRALAVQERGTQASKESVSH